MNILVDLLSVSSYFLRLSSRKQYSYVKNYIVSTSLHLVKLSSRSFVPICSPISRAGAGSCLGGTVFLPALSSNLKLLSQRCERPRVLLGWLGGSRSRTSLNEKALTYAHLFTKRYVQTDSSPCLTVKHWKQSKCPLRLQGENKLGHNCTVEYYVGKRMNDPLLHATWGMGDSHNCCAAKKPQKRQKGKNT